MQPLVYEKYQKTAERRLPKFTEAEIDAVKVSSDLIGINHYTNVPPG